MEWSLGDRWIPKHRGRNYKREGGVGVGGMRQKRSLKRIEGGSLILLELEGKITGGLGKDLRRKTKNRIAGKDFGIRAR